jgi:hypothetical protein
MQSNSNQNGTLGCDHNQQPGPTTERKIMKVSPMSDEFHDWLDSCPVQWFRGEVNKDHVAYYFETPEEDEDASS